jgi:transglutaminase-like putative cysteine protease
MSTPLNRRHCLAALAATASTPWWTASSLAQSPAAPAPARFEPQVGPWRSFELSTTVQVASAEGRTRVWLPVPDLSTDYQQSLDHSWRGNARSARLVADASQGARMLYAEFDPADGAPTLQVTSRLRTRSRAVDWSHKTVAHEDAAVLKKALAPTALLPLDGVVHKTALDITRQARTDHDKVQAIYRWVVASAYREPKTRGCGTGDIKSMLESGNLGGKCADLNAIFVGLCRSVGVPARDVYGLRLAPSAFGYRELGGNAAKLQGAQHCRAEVFLREHGWVAMDPADVLKVMRQETPEWIRDPAHPLVAPVMKGLFGGWEGNWVGYNTAHDVRLPGAGDERGSLPFLMYPQGENAQGRFDELAPDSFRYTISATELKA